MKYLRKFENEAAYSTYTQSEDYITPNISLIKEEESVIFNKYVEPKPNNNEIWYTSTDESVVTPYNTDFGSASIVSNIYKDGQGIITFDSNVTTIGLRTFKGRTTLSTITYPDSVTSIGNIAFSGCTNLVSFNITPFLTSFGTYAFYGTGLKSITIPNSFQSLGYGVFENCEQLLSVNLGSGVTVLNETFRNCYDLSSVTLSGDITVIGINTFYNCQKLYSLILPSTLTSIGIDAFSYSDVSSITYNGTMQQWEAIDKNENWNRGNYCTLVIHCTDGDITVQRY